MDEERLASTAILDFLDWYNVESEKMSAYEKGVVAGLKIAQCLACEIERGQGNA